MELTSKKFDYYIQIQLKLLLIFSILFTNPNVYFNRINQEASLRFFLIIALFSYLIKIIIVQELNWQKTSLNHTLLLFILLNSISLVRNNNYFVGLKDLINFTSYIILFFLIINHLSNIKQIYNFFYIYLLVAFLLSLYTLLQYYNFYPLTKGVQIITSTLGQKNWTANYIAISFFIALPFFILTKERKYKFINFVLLDILYINIMICQSRGIWISIFFAVVLGLYFIYKCKLLKIFLINKKLLLLLFLSFIIITLIYSTENPLNKSRQSILQKAITVFDKEDVSINTRLLIWKNTLNMIRDNPWFGSGIGTFKLNYQIYQANYLEKHPEDIKYWIKAGEAHNEYLQFWSEIGIIGLGIFLLIIFFYYQQILNFFKKEKSSQKKLITLGILVGSTCFLMHCLFSFPLHVPALGAAFFMMVGLNIRLIYLNKENHKNIISKRINIKNAKFKILFIIIILTLTFFLINNIVIKPYYAEINYYKGIILNLNHDFKESLPIFKKAVNLEKHNGRILHALGATYYNLNQYDDAIELFNRAKRYEIDKYTFYLTGLCYLKKNLFFKAEEEFKDSIFIYPLFGEAHYELGYLYFMQERYDETIAQWNKILEIEPHFDNKYIVLNNLGIVYQKKGMPDQALEYFLKALALAPEGNSIIEDIEKEINNIYKSKTKLEE
ncbi:MAG: hypothetical protein Kow00103_05530 [Candidatus Caldatribacteriota bacterium]